MAAIDKIYGTKDEWNRLHAYLVQTKPEYIEKFLYEQPEESGPLSNFDSLADLWLWDNCPLDFVKNRLKEQYNGSPRKNE